MPPPPALSQESDGHTLECLEVWGGNNAVNNGVVMTGLDAWVFSRPCAGNAVGGDIHYLSSCATGRIVRVLVADVSGHGEVVASLARRLRDLMRSLINLADQRRFVMALNKEFMPLTDDGRFATAVAASYWTPTRRLVVTNAGHPMPLRYDAAAKVWSLVRARTVSERSTAMSSEAAGDIPLGIEQRTPYNEYDLTLGEGDLLVLYTDGVIEARGADGRVLGESGLLELVADLDVEPARTLIPRLLAAVEAWARDGGGLCDDDLTLAVLQPNDRRPKSNLHGILGIIRRMLRLG